MKILRVFAKRVWGIQQIDVALDGKSMKISGGNRRGKSSILKTITSGVFGPVEGTIHEGAEEGEILIEMEEVTIHRMIDAHSKSSELTVRVQGERIRAPQKFLDKITRALLFNPIQFYLEKPRAQRDMLLKAIPMEVDELDVLELAQKLTAGALRQATLESVFEDKQPRWDRHPLEVTGELYKAVYDERRTLGQRIDSKREVVNGLSVIEEQPYDAEAHELVKRQLSEMEAAGKAVSGARTAAEAAAQSAEFAQRELTTACTEIERIKEEIARQDALLSEAIKRRTEKSAKYDEAQKLVTEAAERAEDASIAYDSQREMEMRRVEATYSDARAKEQMRAQTQKVVANATDEIEELEEERKQLDVACQFFKDLLPAHLIANAELPIEGVTVDDDGVLIHGRPLDTLSEAEKMNVAIRIAEAQADDDGIQFILLDGIERLDGEQIAALEARAKTGKVQYIVTQVTSGDLKTEAIE